MQTQKVRSISNICVVAMNKFDSKDMSKNSRIVCGIEQRAVSVDTRDCGSSSDRWVVVRTMEEVLIPNSPLPVATKIDASR